MPLCLKQHSKDSLAHSWIKVADSCVFLVLLLLLSGPAARAVVDAFDQEAGVGHDDGGRAYQDHPHPLSALESVAGEVQHEEAEQRQVDSRTQDHLAHLA